MNRPHPDLPRPDAAARVVSLCETELPLAPLLAAAGQEIVAKAV